MPLGDKWKAYFYPETYDDETGQGTLRNKFGERDELMLRDLEYGFTLERRRELDRGDVTIPRTFDAAHVRAIHRHLFQDVYEWAGEYRNIGMQKAGHTFARGREIDVYLDLTRQCVERANWPKLRRDDFAATAAQTFCYLNEAHPFREGNGRTNKIFMQHVAEETGRYGLDFDRIDPDLWNQVSSRTHPAPGNLHPNSLPMNPLFYNATVRARPRAEMEPMDRDIDAMLKRARAAFPQHPREAVRASYGAADHDADAPARYYGRDNPGYGQER